MTPEDPSIAANSEPVDSSAEPTSSSERFRAIGQRLRQAREDQGQERATVAAQLHLTIQLLDDLEAGRMERLAPIYRRGYINSYAALLGLDREELTEGLSDDPPPALTRVLPVRRPRFRFDKYMKFASYLIATIAIVPPLVMVYLNTGVGLFEADQAGSELNRSEQLPLEDRTAEAQDMASPDLAEESQRPVSASAMPLTSIRPSRPPDAAAPVESDVDVMSSGPEGATLDEEPVMTLTLRLLADSWVEISDGTNQRLEYDLLRADQERVYDVEPPLEILIGRASAVNLLLDGEVLSFEGDDRGDVAQLTITEDGVIRR